MTVSILYVWKLKALLPLTIFMMKKAGEDSFVIEDDDDHLDARCVSDIR